MQNHFKYVLTAAQVETTNFHTLRHTFATRCVEAGFDIKSLSEILGHSNVNITMNRYVHPTMELKRQNMQRLSEAFFFDGERKNCKRAERNFSEIKGM
jgi:integrase